MFCHRRPAGGFRRRSGGVLPTVFTAMLVLGLISLVFGGGAGAVVGGMFLLPLLLLKMAFTVFLFLLVTRLLFGSRRPRLSGAGWEPGRRWERGPGRDRRPAAPGWWEDDRRDMTPEEAEWERYLQQARDEVDRIDRSDPGA